MVVAVAMTGEMRGQDEGDDAHGFLPVVAAVGEADRGAGEYVQPAHDASLLGFLFDVLFFLFGQGQGQPGRKGAGGEAHQWGDKQGDNDFLQFAPGHAVDSCGGNAGAEEAADQAVRGADGDSIPPGDEIPDDGGEQDGYHYWQCHCAGGDDVGYNSGYCGADKQRSQEVQDAAHEDGYTGLERLGVDNGGTGVCCVVEAVDKIEAQGEKYRQHGYN